MGCDIHIYTERYYDSLHKWVCCDHFKFNPYYDKYEDDPMDILECVHIYDGRNYKAFAELANVRNYYDRPCISLPRGLPNDVSNIVKQIYERESEWCHSFSYLTVKELLKWVSEHGTNEHTGMVSPEQAKALDEYGTPPTEWCRWTNQQDYVQRTWVTTESPLKYLVDNIKERMVDEFWIWTENEREKEEKINEHAEEFRIVF